jgi:hypothetical protein
MVGRVIPETMDQDRSEHESLWRNRHCSSIQVLDVDRIREIRCRRPANQGMVAGLNPWVWPEAISEARTI